LVVGSCNGSRAAFPDNLLHITKRPLLAIQIHRNVECIRLRTVGHRAPALESGCARTLIDFDSELRDLAWQKSDFLPPASMRMLSNTSSMSCVSPGRNW